MAIAVAMASELDKRSVGTSAPLSAYRNPIRRIDRWGSACQPADTATARACAPRLSRSSGAKCHVVIPPRSTGLGPSSTVSRQVQFTNQIDDSGRPKNGPNSRAPRWLPLPATALRQSAGQRALSASPATHRIIRNQSLPLDRHRRANSEFAARPDCPDLD